MGAAMTFGPHAVVIERSSHAALAVDAGFALRMIPSPGGGVKRLAGLPLRFVGGDEIYHEWVRMRVPGVVFGSEAEVADELWKLRHRGD
jgi:hypothetical protein